MDAYYLFKIYMSLKLHFSTEDYNFLKYGDKYRVKETKFKSRSDYTAFNIISNWIPQSICIEFLISQFIGVNYFSIRNVIEDPYKSKIIYMDWKKRCTNILKIYENDLKTIAKYSNYSWISCIKQNDDDYPLIFKLVVSDKISPETYSLLNDLFNQTNKSYKNLDTDSLFTSINLKYKKYRLFLTPTIKDLLKVTPKDLSKYKLRQ